MMLGYLTFCCFILAQVKGQCLTRELNIKVNNLRKNTRCIIGDTANLRLPTEWPTCKWPCLRKGFEDIGNQPDISCAKTIKSINVRIKGLNKCLNNTSNAVCENAAFGNMAEFLQEAQNYLSYLQRNHLHNQC